jgi:hypothetical protein
MYAKIITLDDLSVEGSEQLLRQIKEKHDSSVFITDKEHTTHYSIGMYPFRDFPLQASLTLQWGGDDYGDNIEKAEIGFVNYENKVFLTLVAKCEGLGETLEKTILEFSKKK